MFQSRTVPGPGEALRTVPAGSGCSIGQAARASGVSAKMIRYYESIGLIRPAMRSAANYRHYDHDAIRTLRFVARARGLGFALEDIARLVALWQEPDRRSADVKSVALAHVAELEGRIAALQAMKAAIERVAVQCHGDGGPQCPILDELWGENSMTGVERDDG